MTCSLSTTLRLPTCSSQITHCQSSLGTKIWMIPVCMITSRSWFNWAKLMMSDLYSSSWTQSQWRMTWTLNTVCNWFITWECQSGTMKKVTKSKSSLWRNLSTKKILKSVRKWRKRKIHHKLRCQTLKETLWFLVIGQRGFLVILERRNSLKMLVIVLKSILELVELFKFLELLKIVTKIAVLE